MLCEQCGTVAGFLGRRLTFRISNFLKITQVSVHRFYTHFSVLWIFLGRCRVALGKLSGNEAVMVGILEGLPSKLILLFF